LNILIKNKYKIKQRETILQIIHKSTVTKKNLFNKKTNNTLSMMNLKKFLKYKCRFKNSLTRVWGIKKTKQGNKFPVFIKFKVVLVQEPFE